MTLEFISLVPGPGYAGPLLAMRHPELAERFHFWRGSSGRRYACTKYPPDAVPAYNDAVAIAVRRVAGEPVVINVSVRLDTQSIRPDADEIHLHLVQDGPEAVDATVHDLSALVSYTPFNGMRRAA